MPELKLQQSRLDGRYDIIECLGRGSYAEIYVAHDNAAAEDGPRRVVIKALNMFLQETPDADLERTLVVNFQNEAVALDRVRHPNVISRLGHGTAIDLEGTTFHYLVLEYLSGGDMSALARRAPLSIEKALNYLEQVCSGLAHAHKAGIIHRDIKPQNLLLTADKRVVKIADFGVARLEASEGAITRVGTNIYSAPEHNPLVQTGQLDPAVLTSSKDLMPAADIYSLAKTTYTLLAGESPRVFAQHPIRALPDRIKDEFWSRSILRVLEKATQTRILDRYQTVEEFWDELAEAALPPTRPLLPIQPDDAPLKRPSADLTIDPDEFTQAAPPQPRFEVPRAEQSSSLPIDSLRRPRIVVPFNKVKAEPPATRRSNARTTLADLSAGAVPIKHEAPPATRTRRFLVALLLILAFSGMLLATHKYVTSHWTPSNWIPQLGETFVVGREGVTTTDVNLRPDASTASSPIGIAEVGSKVKVLNIDNNWYEVQVLAHGRTKTDPFSSDRGWINKKFVRFD
ncbi:MAG TPA: protein kinase [Pyrinomonadaceae bacterium]|nr:protein kinase [Pyrinomonadaceae bacterium]